MSRPPIAAPRGVLLTLTLGLVLGPAAPAMSAQVSLRDALAAARAGAYPARIARGALDAARAQAAAPLAGMLPNASLELGAMRTTDPIGAFGTRLRQREVTPSAFDPAALNFPAAVSNYAVGLVVQAPVLNADAWAGRAAASAGAAAAQAASDWAGSEAEVEVIKAWYGAVLADELVATLRTARAAAAAHVGQATALRNAGMATKSDLLLAELRVGDLDARLAQAEADADNARRGLALRAGTRRTDFDLPPALPSAAAVRPWLALPERAATRGDVAAASAAMRAARLDVTRATAAVLPRLNSFARWDWNSALRPWAGRENWTAGVMLTVPIFNVGSQFADRSVAGGRWRQAEAAREAADARADFERRHAAGAASVALRRLDIAEKAVGQADEAHRLVSRRYEGGLATIAELLTAHAARTEAALGLASARHQAIAVAAELRRAHGLSATDLATLDDMRQTPSVATP